ncbi:hypothetical protein [Calderihabitans maritimus]|uniref:Uncharacterized protein n=1 Tax=Calderihabitans maritimus TaxID=1246530 RepID=A0A1Z5HXS9_9FIRM|nr:hypothetical protein [Calderihabitans maritimus]GAW94336.1 hypothetical protein Daud_0444 [Calderihabitans maritimus]
MTTGKLLTPSKEEWRKRYAATETRQGKRAKKRSGFKQFLAGLFLFVLWIGTVYVAYSYIENRLAEQHAMLQAYIDRQVQNIQETNALNIQTIVQKQERLLSELTKIKRALEEADEVISQSNSTREALDERITQLDKQLENLKESLRILQETVDAKN